MSVYGECYKCSGDLICPDCESHIPVVTEDLLDTFFQVLSKELDGKLTQPEIIRLASILDDLFV